MPSWARSICRLAFATLKQNRGASVAVATGLASRDLNGGENVVYTFTNDIDNSGSTDRKLELPSSDLTHGSQLRHACALSSAGAGRTLTQAVMAAKVRICVVAHTLNQALIT